MFTMAFLWSSIGILVGALSAGPIGDRFGRRPLLLGSLTIFGIASLLSAAAGSLGMLSFWRFFTGLGIGGGFSGAAALTGDYAPHRLRATMIMVDVHRCPPGRLRRRPDRRVAARAFRLADDLYPRRCVPAASGAGAGAVAAGIAAVPGRRGTICRRVTPHCCGASTSLRRESGPVDIARGNPVRMLFGKGYALQTVLLWIVYFCSLLNLFLFAYWMPTVLNLIGFTPAQAVFASSMRDFGAIFAVLYLGVAIDRIGPERTLALHYAAGAVFIAVIALMALPYAMLLIMTFLAGATIIGSQTGANGTCGKLYPARMRTSGLGWALGIGRLGGIAAPVLGGYLLARGLAPTHIFLSACLFALIAAAATALLAFRGSRVPMAGVEEVAP